MLASGPRTVGVNGYLRFSLGTGNRKEAERLARRHAVEVDELLQALDDSPGQEMPTEQQFTSNMSQKAFDALSPEEQVRVAATTLIEPSASFTPEGVQRAAHLMYVSFLQEDEAEYGKLLARLMAPGGSADDSEDRLLIPREHPFFVGDLPPPGPVGDIALLREVSLNIVRFLQLSTGRRYHYWDTLPGMGPLPRPSVPFPGT